MRLLLDTHAVIWFITADPNLPSSTKKLIEEANLRYVSMASLWEISIKHSINKLELETDLSKLFDLIIKSGIEILNLLPDHLLKQAQLPLHHRDPFDRLLVAQAISENLTLVSCDEHLKSYNTKIIW